MNTAGSFTDFHNESRKAIDFVMFFSLLSGRAIQTKRTKLSNIHDTKHKANYGNFAKEKKINGQILPGCVSLVVVDLSVYKRLKTEIYGQISRQHPTLNIKRNNDIPIFRQYHVWLLMDFSHGLVD